MNNPMDYQLKKSEYIKLINEKLYSYIVKNGDEYDIVKEAMLYSLSAGGKRIRPMLTLEFCLASGGNIESALPFACAVEMIHCYSLIHDDLPCMDDDDMRRGKPSCHKKFGYANALLAGDALLTKAFHLIADGLNHGVSAEACLKASSILSQCAGIDGMVGGQVIDLQNEEKTPSEEILFKTDLLKTSALIAAACTLGVCAANGNETALQKAKEYALSLGVSFQIQDDVLDVIGTEEELGKPIGSDEQNQKTTYVTLLGLDGAKELALKKANEAIETLGFFKENGFLTAFTKEMLNRKN